MLKIIKTQKQSAILTTIILIVIRMQITDGNTWCTMSLQFIII